MNRGLVFFLGILTGFILTILFMWMFAFNRPSMSLESSETSTSETKNPDITLAEQQTEFTDGNKFEVFKVLDNGALARCADKQYYPVISFTGPTVYIVADGQNLFYDKQVIEVPKGKKAIQTGVYRYRSAGSQSVAPVIEFQ